MEESTVSNILYVVLAIFGSGLSLLFMWAVKKLINYLDKKTSVLDQEQDLAKKEALKKRVLEVVRAAVDTTFQTYVDEVRKAKEDGKLTKDESEKAFAMTQEAVLSVLKSEGVSLAGELLKVLIEQSVRERNLLEGRVVTFVKNL